jgi:hypothetical protein
MVTGSIPVGCITQHPENKVLTDSGKSSGKPENEILSKSCFSEQEIDADLKLIIERWPKLSVELRKAIVKMVQ